MKKNRGTVAVIALLIVVVVAVSFALVACSSDNESSDGSSKTPTLSQQELDQMYQQACDYEKEAKFKSAIELFRELRTYDYYDKDFGHNGLDGALETREWRYLSEKILCRCVESAVRSLKSKLKDPSSLVINKVSFKANKDIMTVTLDYSAKNSFGGMVRDSFSYNPVGFMTIQDEEKIYEMNKEFMDSRGLTSADSLSFLASNNYIEKASQFAAIVAGDCNY